MNEVLKQRLEELPKTPGVYFHKNAAGDIIYIGKAAVLRNRVRQYFQSSRSRDPKTEALVAEIADVEWAEVETELDALFLEAEMVRRYMPQYNILLRDDKSSVFVRIDFKSEHPTVSYTRRPLDDAAEYLGPYFSKFAVMRALKYLRKAFPYSTHLSTNMPKRACLQAHLGLCPGLESGMTSLEEYRKNLRHLKAYLTGKRVRVVDALEKDMKRAAKAKDFEQAAVLRNKLSALRNLQKQIIFSDREFLDISKDKGLTGLADLLGLSGIPKRIEGYDISHMSGTDTVASMVVFSQGIPDKVKYRKFKMRLPGNDDFAHMHEVISRRLSAKNVKDWGLPDIFLIDGGKGQLSAAIKARDECGFELLPMIGLAKREEEIVVHVANSRVVLSTTAAHAHNALIQESTDFQLLLLPKRSDIVKLLQRIRDESHRFAVSYHSVLKRARQTESWLETVPTIGPASRKKLMKEFGSVRGVMQARGFELEKVLGAKRAVILRQYIRAEKKHGDASGQHPV